MVEIDLVCNAKQGERREEEERGGDARWAKLRGGEGGWEETNRNSMSAMGSPCPWRRWCSSADETSGTRMQVSGMRTRAWVDQRMQRRVRSQAGWGWGMWMRGKERRGVLALGVGRARGILGSEMDEMKREDEMDGMRRYNLRVSGVEWRWGISGRLSLVGLRVVSPWSCPVPLRCRKLPLNQYVVRASYCRLDGLGEEAITLCS